MAFPPPHSISGLEPPADVLQSSSRGSAEEGECIGVQDLAGEWVRRCCEEALVLLQPEELVAPPEAHGKDAALIRTQRA